MIRAMFLWLGTTPLGALMRDSTWGFASVEAVHLLALAALGGAALVLDLTALRLLFRREDGGGGTGRAVLPLLWASLGVLVLSGALLVASKPLRYYLDDVFRLKMALLALLEPEKAGYFNLISSFMMSPR